MPESRLPYIQALVDEIGLDALADVEAHAVRLRPIPDSLARDLADVGGLSPHEVRILRLTAEGLTREEIAEVTGNKTDTIKDHMKSIHRKLGTRNQGQTVLRAIQLGYLDA